MGRSWLFGDSPVLLACVIFLAGIGYSLAWSWYLASFQEWPKDRASSQVLPQTCRETPTLLLGMTWESIPNLG